MAKKSNVGSREVEPFQVQNPRPVLVDDALYSGDGGRLFCGRHAGASARYSGRDLSGQRVHRYSDRDRQDFELEIGRAPECETCACERRVAARDDGLAAGAQILAAAEVRASHRLACMDALRGAGLVPRDRDTPEAARRIDEASAWMEPLLSGRSTSEIVALYSEVQARSAADRLPPTPSVDRGGVVLVQRYAIEGRYETEIWADDRRRACWEDGSRVTEDQVDRLPIGEALRALVVRERLTVLGFASEAAIERVEESEIQLWRTEL